MGSSDAHEALPSPGGRDARRAAVAAACALAAVACIYHTAGATVAEDALRAVLAGAACTALLAWSRRGAAGGRAAAPGRRRAALLASLAVLACALACCAADALWGGGRQAGWAPPGAAALAVLAASCLGTAAWEEALFRELLPRALTGGLRPGKGRCLACAAICSALFGLLHAGGAEGALAAARLCQTALFGMAMAGLAARPRGLAWAVGAHGAFDAVCFSYSLARAAGSGAASGAGLLGLAAEELLGPAASPAGLAASLPVLAALAAWAARLLLRAGASEEEEGNLAGRA